MNSGKSYSKGYLICSECGGYYKLEEGESPSDFVSCQCGGSLQYYDSLEEAYRKKPHEINETTEEITSRKFEIIKESEIIQEPHEEIIGAEITDNRETLESLLKKDLDGAQDFISTIQNKRKEIKTHKKTNYLTIFVFIIVTIILLIILISGKPLLSI